MGIFAHSFSGKADSVHGQRVPMVQSIPETGELMIPSQNEELVSVGVKPSSQVFLAIALFLEIPQFKDQGWAGGPEDPFRTLQDEELVAFRIALDEPSPVEFGMIAAKAVQRDKGDRHRVPSEGRSLVNVAASGQPPAVPAQYPQSHRLRMIGQAKREKGHISQAHDTDSPRSRPRIIGVGLESQDASRWSGRFAEVPSPVRSVRADIDRNIALGEKTGDEKCLWILV